MTKASKVTLTHIKDIVAILGLIITVISSGALLTHTVKENKLNIVALAEADDCLEKRFDKHLIDSATIKSDIKHVKEGISEIKAYMRARVEL